MRLLSLSELPPKNLQITMSFKHFPALRVLLFYPLLTAAVVALLLWLFEQPWKYIQLGIICAWVWHSMTQLALGLWVSWAHGRLAGFLGGLLSGLLLCGMHYGIVSILAVSLFSLGVLSLILQQQQPPVSVKYSRIFATIVGSLLLGAALLFMGNWLGMLLSAHISTVAALPLRLTTMAILVGVLSGWLSGGLLWMLLSMLLMGLGFGSWLLQGLWLSEPISQGWQYALTDTVRAAVLALLGSGLYALAYVPARHWAGIRVAVIAGSLSALFHMVLIAWFSGAGWWVLWLPGALLLGWTYLWWRSLLLYPLLEVWHWLLLLKLQNSAMISPQTLRQVSWHAAFRDKWQLLPWRSLLAYLLWLQQQDEAATQDYLQQLEHSHQHWVIAEFYLALNLKSLAQVASLEAMGQVHQQIHALPNTHPMQTLLQRFQMVSRDVAVVTEQTSRYTQRLVLRDSEELLNRLIMDLEQSRQQAVKHLLPLARQWRALLTEAFVQFDKTLNASTEMHNPYIVGIPLNSKQEIFVGRHDIIADIEKLLFTLPAPPVLIYGQRRTGKTSLLSNLNRLLPSRFIFAYLDFQSPRMLSGQLATMLEGIAFSVRLAFQHSLQRPAPALDKALLETDPLHAFALWLEAVEAQLGEHTLVLALDEFVALEDKVMAQTTLHELLSLFRHIIQHHPSWRLLLAGSHQLDELRDWAGYLVNMQVLHLGFLPENYARQLITRPVVDFPLSYAENTVSHLISLSSGHPALVQLLCRELVNLKNRQDESQRYLARMTDIEAAAVSALQTGTFYFSDMLHNQITSDGLELLRYLAKQGEGIVISQTELVETFGDSLEKRLHQVLRRELLQCEQQGYRFSVELVRRAVVAELG
ncbi:Archaeal ATPase [Candidatus Venteria ishoeyi]|uniref:Archaeal ATPase n=2 Tax=Candidatus Venteria ishoeyi TaxID=1899563 RepID=A0A1H6FF10_9GAMM|nr:Archaeal ATPase [Candidatus Venteria ishoeyi]